MRWDAVVEERKSTLRGHSKDDKNGMYLPYGEMRSLSPYEGFLSHVSQSVALLPVGIREALSAHNDKHMTGKNMLRYQTK